MPEVAGEQLSTPEYKVIIGTGEMANAVRSFDWSQTPVGPIAVWPRSLITAANICLNSRFPMVMWWGRELTLIYNDAWRPVLGASKHPRALGSPGQQIWPEIWDTIGRQLNSVLETGNATWSDDLLLVLDRNFYTEEAYFTYSYSPIPLEDGTVGGVFSAVSETTQRVIGERRLETLRRLGITAAEAKTTEEAYRRSCQVLDDNPWDIPFALLYLLDTDGKTARLIESVRLQRGFAYCPEQIQFEDAGSAVWPLANVIRTGMPEHLTDLVSLVGEMPGGKWPAPPAEAVVIPMAKPGQAQVAGLAVMGISPYRKFDNDYRSFLNLAVGHIATGAANAHAYEQERKRAEALAEMDRVKTTFFSNVSHEFRTPLTLMLGPLEEVLAETEIPPRNRELVTVAHRNSLRLLKLVNSLLDFSRMEGGRLQVRYEPVDLASFTAEIASNFRSATEQAGLEFVIDCPELPDPVYVDREMWEKIVLNLISNAFKFTFEGAIRVELSSVNHTAELNVKDTGAGIPAHELPRLFDRFHRVEGARGRTHEGTGIGLALVQELTKMHGGTVSVESQLGRGSTFTVRIPLGREHLPDDRVVTGPSAAGAATRVEAYVNEALRWLPEGNGEPTGNDYIALERDDLDESNESIPIQPTERSRVLLAEDNADMREYVRRLLGPHMDVMTVSNGRDALQQALANPPDLILSDVMMPVMDGFALLTKLRADPRTNTLPVILLSARAGEESRVEGVTAGADDYLVKPFSARELLARVNAHLKLARVRRQAEETLRASEAALQQANDELRHVNRELEEFAYVASHDLQEPLRMVNSYSQLLIKRLRTASEEDAQKYVDFIRTGVRRMEDLIQDLLSFARTVQSEKPVAQPVDLNVSLSQALEVLRPQIETSQARIEIGELPFVMADETQVPQLFQNLLSNALKYTKPDVPPFIQISARPGEREWIIAVRDHGIGFRQEFASHIFGLFKRLHRSEYPGTGLGLAICQRIAERYGGRIWAESLPGEGSTFYFTFLAGQPIDGWVNTNEQLPTRALPTDHLAQGARLPATMQE